jgi:hypothetical protein
MGTGSGHNSSGNVDIVTGTAANIGNAGSINLTCGTGASFSGGSIVLTPSAGTGGTIGSVNLILTGSRTLKINSSSGTSGQALISQGTSAPIWGTPSVSAAGADKQVQFNDGGTVLGGDADFTWDKTANLLTIAGTAGSLSIAQASSRIYIKSANDGTATIFQAASANSNTIFGICPSGTADACSIRVWTSSSPTNGYFGQLSIVASVDSGAPFVGLDSSNNNNAGGYPIRVRITPSGSTTANNYAGFYNNGNINFGASNSDPGIAFNVQGYAKHDLPMGIQTTPATTYNGITALEIGTAGVFLGSTGANYNAFVAGNLRYLTTTNWTYKNTAAGGVMTVGEDILFQSTPSGTAGTAATLTQRLKVVGANGTVVIGDNATALATNATDGFLYVPTCAGTPTGAPTAQTGTAPIVIDTTNNKLYFRSGGAWRDAGP